MSRRLKRLAALWETFHQHSLAALRDADHTADRCRRAERAALLEIASLGSTRRATGADFQLLAQTADAAIAQTASAVSETRRARERVRAAAVEQRQIERLVERDAQRLLERTTRRDQRRADEWAQSSRQRSGNAEDDE